MLSHKPAETTLYAELVRRGLPADYAQRTAEELDDHRSDLLADLRAGGEADPEAVADERLGETRRLAKRIARDYRRRSWFGRWPLVSFLLLPVLVLSISWTGGSLALIGLLCGADWAAGGEFLPTDSIWGDVRQIEAIVFTGWLVVFLAAPTLAAGLLGRLALRTTQSRVYAMTACSMIALFNGLVFTWAQPMPDDPTQARMLIGVMAPIGGPETFTATVTRLYTSHPGQLLQLLAPLAVMGLLTWRDAKRRRCALLAPPPVPFRERLAA